MYSPMRRNTRNQVSVLFFASFDVVVVAVVVVVVYLLAHDVDLFLFFWSKALVCCWSLVFGRPGEYTSLDYIPFIYRSNWLHVHRPPPPPRHAMRIISSLSGSSAVVRVALSIGPPADLAKDYTSLARMSLVSWFFTKRKQRAARANIFGYLSAWAFPFFLFLQLCQSHSIRWGSNCASLVS